LKVVINNPDDKYNVSNHLTANQVDEAQKLLVSAAEKKLSDFKEYFGDSLKFELTSMEIKCVPVRGQFIFNTCTQIDKVRFNYGKPQQGKHSNIYYSQAEAVASQQTAYESFKNYTNSDLRGCVDPEVDSSMFEQENTAWKVAAVESFAHHETCQSCSGGGRIYHDVHIPASVDTCRSCNGHGDYNCQTCYGAGYYKNRYNQFVTCEICYGHGSLVCNSCSGSGKSHTPPIHNVQNIQCGGCLGHGTTHSVYSASVWTQTERKLNIQSDDIFFSHAITRRYKSSSAKELFDTASLVIWNPDRTEDTFGETSGRVLRRDLKGAICLGKFSILLNGKSKGYGSIYIDSMYNKYINRTDYLEPTFDAVDIAFKKQVDKLSRLLKDKSEKDVINNYIKSTPALRVIHSHLRITDKLKLRLMIDDTNIYNNAVKVTSEADTYLKQSTAKRWISSIFS